VDEAQLTAGVVADRRWKAAATLLLVLLTFVPLWSPYFAYTLYLAVQRNLQVLDGGPAGDHVVETAVVWIGFATFASNAFVYGWNRNCSSPKLAACAPSSICFTEPEVDFKDQSPSQRVVSVYGWMNRAIRDALRDTVDAAVSRCPLAAQGRARLSQVLGAGGDAEDFFQFLERTSSFDRAQSITQASVELTSVQ